MSYRIMSKVSGKVLAWQKPSVITIQNWQPKQADRQQWIFSYEDEEGYIHILDSQMGGTCLAAPDIRETRPLILKPFDRNDDSQKWERVITDTTYFDGSEMLRNKKTGLYMECRGYDSGAYVVQSEKRSREAYWPQQWYISTLPH